MTKIRCQICGGEELHSEGDILVVCDRCGNRTLLIPEQAIVSKESPVESSIVTIKYDRKKTGCPRRSFCLNDKMEPDAEPCKVCNLVKKKYREITKDMVEKYNERDQYLKEHPELADVFGDEVLE